MLSCPTTKMIRDPGSCCPRCEGKGRYIIFIIRDESRARRTENLSEFSARIAWEKEIYLFDYIIRFNAYIFPLFSI